MKYRPEINGLRAVAVLPVIFFHAGFPLFAGGYVGVDVFFVISGYLITSIILHDLKNGTFSLRKFYERRARRILPPLFLVLLACTIASWLLFAPSDFAEFSTSLIAVALYVSNFFFWQEYDYFATATEFQPLLHTWSLAVEEQYYLIFPLLVLVIWKLGKRSLVFIISLLLLLSLYFANELSNSYPTAAFYLLPTRAWELLVGSLVAIYLMRVNSRQVPRALREVLSWLGFAAIAYSIFTFNELTPMPSYQTLWPVLGTAAVILFGNNGTILFKILSREGLVLIGLLSYGAYLWHQPIFVYTRIWLRHEPSVQTYFLLIFLSLAMAYISGRFLEKPFRFQPRFSRKFIYGFAATGTVLFVYAGFTLPSYQIYQFSTKQLQVFATAEASPLRDECHEPQNEYAVIAAACPYFGENKNIAVIGNSHAVELAYALASELKNSNRGIYQYTISGCIHNFRIKSEAETICARWHRSVLERVLQRPTVDTVVLSYRNEEYLNQFKYRNALIEYAKAYLAAGKKVVVVLQAPMLESPINNYLANTSDSGLDFLPALNRANWTNTYQGKDKLIRGLPPEVLVVDPADLFCNANQCFATKYGESLFFDNNHMSVSGGKLVAQQILQEIENK